MLVGCWGAERRHKSLKKYASNICGGETFERHILINLLNQVVDSMAADEDLAAEVCLHGKAAKAVRDQCLALFPSAIHVAAHAYCKGVRSNAGDWVFSGREASACQ